MLLSWLFTEIAPVRYLRDSSVKACVFPGLGPPGPRSFSLSRQHFPTNLSIVLVLDFRSVKSLVFWGFRVPLLEFHQVIFGGFWPCHVARPRTPDIIRGEEVEEKVGIGEGGGDCKIVIILSTVHNQRKTLIQIAHFLGSDRKAPVV